MLDRDRFSEQFQRFKSLVPVYDDGRAFTDFDKGVVHRWEGYKTRLRDEALDILVPEIWTEVEIGSGAILERTIKAIEIKDNKLVGSQPHWGPSRSGHRVLLEARRDAELRVELERRLFDLFAGVADEGTTFDRLKDIIGARYPLLGYLFFLKDMDRFMPNRPKIFDRAFHDLGIDLITTRKGSWENYLRFNSSLGDVRSALAEMDGLTNVRLIDAHSFCWIIERMKFDRKKAIVEMLNAVAAAVRHPNSQIVERVVKNKERRMTQAELNELLGSLLDQQRNRCALTGIPFDNAKKDLRPSVDRIDSDGHYEQHNLQIVCQFVNFWKGDPAILGEWRSTAWRGCLAAATRRSGGEGARQAGPADARSGFRVGIGAASRCRRGQGA